MNNSQRKTLKNATGKIDYTLMNDCMFHIVMQSNKKVLKGLVCALLHLNPDDVQSVTILNPLEFGEHIRDKDFILDIKVLLNSQSIINIELQVRAQNFWNDRSLSYLCRLFDNLEKGENYFDVRPAYHIGIVNFTPFPDYPEFYATNMMMNIKKHYIYNDKFMLNVLDLNQIRLATDEDKQWKLDYWARLFQSKTWEELKMLAQQNDVFMETCETIFQKNQDEKVRYWCEAREEAGRIARSVRQDFENQLAEKDSIIAEQSNILTEKDNTITEQSNVIAKKDRELALRDAEIKRLLAENEKLRKEHYH